LSSLFKQFLFKFESLFVFNLYLLYNRLGLKLLLETNDIALQVGVLLNEHINVGTELINFKIEVRSTDRNGPVEGSKLIFNFFF